MATPKEDTHPKFAYPPGGHPTIYQRPKGEVKGILLYLHGCGAYVTDMYTQQGKDGFLLNACDKQAAGSGEWVGYTSCRGKKAEVMLRQKARARGYLVASVQGGQNKNQTRCTNSDDIPFIKNSLKFIREKEKLEGVQVMLMGFSSGGRTVPELAHFMGKSASCSVVVANEVRTKGNSDAELNIPHGYPSSVPIMFVHMPHDDHRETDIRKNIHQFRAKNITTGEIQVGWGQKHFLAGAAYMDDIIDWCETGKAPEKTHATPPADWVTEA